MIETHERAREEQAPNLTPPPGNPRFPLFDALRAIAALSVFAGHTITQVFSFSVHRTLFLWAAQVSDQGLTIFFLISGFLLYRPFLNARRRGSPLGARSYASRRFLRIVPAYWVAMTIFVAAGLVSGVTGHNWWIFYGFGQVYSWNTVSGGLGVAWSLCVEVTFYGALPVFVWVAGRLGRARRSLVPDVVLILVLAAGSLVFRAHFTGFTQVPKILTLAGTFLWFALGMLLALASIVLGERGAISWLRAALPDAWPLLSWLLAIGAFVLGHEAEVHSLSLGTSGTAAITYVLAGLCALFILLPAVFEEDRGGPVRALLRTRTLGWIGLISYGFYLYHTVVIGQLRNLIGHAQTFWRYVALLVSALLLSLLCAAASYYLLERPLMRLGRRSARRPVDLPPDASMT